jgi:ribonuclease VapC
MPPLPQPLLESALVAETRRGEPAGRELDLLLHRAEIQTVPVDAEQIQIARSAWRRYGKGHPAGLNYGDCLAYALAAASGEPLLFTGHDFRQTDIPAGRRASNLAHTHSRFQEGRLTVSELSPSVE